MATITLRVDDPVREQLQAMAEGRGVSVSDLVRSLIDGLFDRDDRAEPRRTVVPESMTAVDRKQLALLHKILARLVEEKIDDDRLGDDGNTSYQLDRAQALEEGWTTEYDLEFYVMQPELSRRECGLVMDLLDMFRILKVSVAKVAAELSEDELLMLEFDGFDGNDNVEGRLLDYARWLVSDKERWQEQAEVFSRENDAGNSHSPRLRAYRRMLEAYEPIWNSVVHRRGRRTDYLLTVDELRQIAAAAIHPSNRTGR
ncbi:YfbU family protein [Kribbella sp. NPDC004536]|uniref:YfbU family protein n=1 Tax=Kribbella sp. NPDC004536 TaxID=3364106 RepID=UPI0036AAE0FE